MRVKAIETTPPRTGRGWVLSFASSIEHLVHELRDVGDVDLVIVVQVVATGVADGDLPHGWVAEGKAEGGRNVRIIKVECITP